MRLLENYPNFRKAAPEGMRFVFPSYLGDISVNIDTRFKVERIMWTGMYEPPLMRWLQAQKLEGWTCLDIGANVGAVTLALAKFVGRSGQVVSFEPGPPNLARLHANLALNPDLMTRVEVIEAGVASEPGELWWSEEKGNPGNALLGKSGTHRIPVIKIDDFVAERQIPKIDFMKIDVEGMELDVMRGARETLRRFHPTLYFETLPRYTDTGGGPSFTDMFSFLVGELDYNLYCLDSRGELSQQTPGHHSSYTVAIHKSYKQ